MVEFLNYFLLSLSSALYVNMPRLSKQAVLEHLIEFINALETASGSPMFFLSVLNPYFSLVS